MNQTNVQNLTIPALWERLLHLNEHGGRYAPLSLAHIEYAEAALGFTLPDDLVHTYLRGNLVNNRSGLGVPGLYGWFALSQAVYLARAHTFVVHKLRPATQTGFQDHATVADDQAVRFDRWNRGWFPVGQCESAGDLLCVDLAPGPAGRVGQVIVVPSMYAGPRQRKPEAYRVLAPSWHAYLAGLVGASINELAPVPTVVRSSGERAQLGTALDSSWTAEEARCVQAMAAAWAERAPPLPELLPMACAVLSSGGQEGLAARAEGKLNVECMKWLTGQRMPSIWWVLGGSGSGKTVGLQDMAQRALAAGAQGRDLPVPIVIDLNEHEPLGSFESVLEAHAQQHGGAPGSGALLQKAVRLGQATLFLDNITHLMSSDGVDAVAWCRDLAALCPPAAIGRAQVARAVITCNSEYLLSLAHVQSVSDFMRPAWDSTGKSIGWVRLDGIEEESRSHMVTALLGSNDWTQALQEQFDWQGNLLDRLASRPGFLMTFASVPVFEPSRLNTFVGQQICVLAWERWVQLQAGRAPGVLSVDELMLLAQRLIAPIAAAYEASGHNHTEGLPFGHFVQLVQSLRAEWAPGALDAAVLLARRALMLTTKAHASVDFLEDFLVKHLRARPIVRALLADNVEELARALPAFSIEGHAEVQWVCFGLWCQGRFEQPPHTLAALLASPQRSEVMRPALHLAMEWSFNLQGFPGVTAARRALFPQPPARLELSGMRLDKMELGAPMAGAMLDGAVLDNASLRDTDLSGASLRAASAVGARLSGADLRGADATGLVAPRSHWDGALVQGLLLRNANLGGAHLLGLQGESLMADGADTAFAVTDEQWQSLAKRPDSTWGSDAQQRTWRHLWVLPQTVICLQVQSADGLLEAIACQDGVVHLMHRPSGMLVRQLVVHHGVPTCLLFSPEHRRLAMGFADGQVQLWDAVWGGCLHDWQAPDEAAVPVSGLAFDAAQRLCCQMDNGLAFCVQAEDGKTKWVDDTLQWSQNRSQKMVANLRSSESVVSALEHPVFEQVWVDSECSQEGQSYETSTGRWITSVSKGERAWSRDGLTSLLLFRRTQIRALGELRPVIRMPALCLHAQRSVEEDAFVAVTDQGHVMRVGFDGLASLLMKIPKTYSVDRSKYGERLVSALSAHGTYLAAWTPSLDAALLWDLRQPKAPPVELVPACRANCFAFSADGQYLAIGDENGELSVVRQGETEPCLQDWAGQGPVASLAFVHGGQRVVSACRDACNLLKVWDLASGSAMWTLPWTNGPITDFLPLRNGDLLVISSVAVCCVKAEALAAEKVPIDWWRYQFDPQSWPNITLYPDGSLYQPGEPNASGRFWVELPNGKKMPVAEPAHLLYEKLLADNATAVERATAWPEFVKPQDLPLMRRPSTCVRS